MGPKSPARNGICRDDLPLQTLRADIDFGFAQAYTTYGVIGVKCWVYSGEKVPERGTKPRERDAAAALAV